jgi:RecG-like helicase
LIKSAKIEASKGQVQGVATPAYRMLNTLKEKKSRERKVKVAMQLTKKFMNWIDDVLHVKLLLVGSKEVNKDETYAPSSVKTTNQHARLGCSENWPCTYTMEFSADSS